MKPFFTSFVILAVSTSAFAASVLNLNEGDVVTINANQQVIVSCGNDQGQQCQKATAYLSKLLEVCQKSTEAIHCIRKEWPKFQTTYPNCIVDAFDICYSACTKGSNSNYCLDFCKAK